MALAMTRYNGAHISVRGCTTISEEDLEVSTLRCGTKIVSLLPEENKAALGSNVPGDTMSMDGWIYERTTEQADGGMGPWKDGRTKTVICIRTSNCKVIVATMHIPTLTVMSPHPNV